MKPDRVIAVRNTRTVYRDGSRCLKVFGESHPKSEVLGEAMNLARAEEAGIKVPRLIEVSAVDGQWAIIYEYIKGDTLAYLMDREPEKKDEYLRRFVDIQVSVQSHICPALGRLKDIMRAEIGRAKLSSAVRRTLQKRLDELPEQNSVCHGDFNPTNIIISGSEPYIIDWRHAAQGCPEADAARTYLLFRQHGDIGGARRYLELYCKKTSAVKARIIQWIPIVAAAQSVRGNEKEREFLLGMIYASDFE